MSFYLNTRTIMKRELAGYFGSALAYVFIVIFLIVQGFFTFYISNLYEGGQADLNAFFGWLPWLFMLLVPAISMRLWSEERRLGTIELLFTLPITVGETIIGKFLAAWIFIGISLALTFPVVITVSYLGSPDLGVIFCGYIGSFLMAGAFLSIGAMTSALTRSQVISFIIAVLISLFLILTGFPPVTEALKSFLPDAIVTFTASLSILTHFNAVSRGVLALSDISYFLSVIIFMLFLNHVSLVYHRD